ncbi:FANCD2 opposite strand protein [Mixophyes fleayi]|uniref:FANCD2 opposite strand protein n=1 Tax=Mixophyes fleayi TaxID=3061075 RepID=UPI003F4E109F
MATYQLWSPWTPLDESLQWIRRATPKLCSKHPHEAIHGSPYSSSMGVQALSLILGNRSSERGPDSNERTAQEIQEIQEIITPKPIFLLGLDLVFCTTITVQPPKWSGSFRLSQKSAFSRVISKQYLLPSGLKQPEVKLVGHMCKQLLHSILLLYITYKKCRLVLQHSQPNPDVH